MSAAVDVKPPSEEVVPTKQKNGPTELGGASFDSTGPLMTLNTSMTNIAMLSAEVDVKTPSEEVVLSEPKKDPDELNVSSSDLASRLTIFKGSMVNIVQLTSGAEIKTPPAPAVSMGSNGPMEVTCLELETCSAGMDPVTVRRKRRSLWYQTKTFVRRVF